MPRADFVRTRTSGWVTMLTIQVNLYVCLAVAQQQTGSGHPSTQNSSAIGHAQDAVSKAFEDARQNAKLPKLRRTTAPASQRAYACDAAKTGKPRLLAELSLKTNSFVTYKTTTPEAPTSELTQLAQKNGSYFKRFSVAAWPDNSGTDREFWIIVQLRGSAGSEFFENHFTDAIEWRNDWKKEVAPACKNIH
jgi:hypothetical protein